MSAKKYFLYKFCMVLAAALLFFAIAFSFSEPAYTAISISPLPSPGAAVSPGPSMVPITSPTPRPTVTPWNQLGHSATPKPDPTADPMIQQFVREDVEKASKINVSPTPPVAVKNKQLSVQQAAAGALDAAKASFLTLDITRLNIQKQIGDLAANVTLAGQAIDLDDRYKVLVEQEEIWGDRLDEDLKIELEMFRSFDVEPLTSDQRRFAIGVRDLGYDRFNQNIKKVDHNIEIMRNQLKYAAYAQYAGVAKLQAAVAIQQEALGLQLKNLEILKVKFELGTATRIEVENAELSYEISEIELRKQKRSLTSLVTGFNRLIGENLSTTYQDFDRSKLTPPRKDDPVEKYMSAAKENRSDIILAYDEMLLTQRQADLYEIQKEITNYSTLADKQETLQSAEEAAITYDAAVQEVEGEINEAYKQLVALRGVTGYYESQLKTAQDNYDRSQSLYEMGMATAASVDQVRMSLTQAKMQLENNMIDIWQQRQKLEIISGIGPGGI